MRSAEPRVAAAILLTAALAIAPAGESSAVGPPAGGAITLSVDAREADRKLVHTREVIPAGPGTLRLVYPKWIPGEHGPTGPVGQIAGLRVSSNGQPIEWCRDLADMFSIHCEVPAGAGAVTVEFDVQTTQEGSAFGPEVSASSQLALLNWNQFLLYPAGAPSDSVVFAADVAVPEGWHFATALAAASPATARDSGACAFAPVTLTQLVDSPVLAGRYLARIELNPGESPPATLVMAGDSRAALELPPARLAAFRALVGEARAMFGARHYERYLFLVSLSDHVAPLGLEHHQSTDIRDGERALVDPAVWLAICDVFAHEYVHSWNGKYRRPAGLATPDYQQPMTGELLWAYEGLTHYLGYVLAARCGHVTPEQFREMMAANAADLETERGRDWRPLVDTGTEAQLLYTAPKEGRAWRRGVDFYSEGALAWLEADAVLREQSGGRVKLDDFLRRFFGGADSGPRLVPYTLDDMLAALNALVPHDWKTFFADRVERLAPHPPLAALERHGWRLAWRDSSSEYTRALEEYDEDIQLEYSIGIKVASEAGFASGAGPAGEAGEIRDVVPGSPAAKAGIAPGMKLIAVNGRAWSTDVLRDAVRATASGEPLELLVSNTGYFKTFRLEYRGGERYPWLERVPGRADLLAEIVRPRAARPK